VSAATDTVSHEGYRLTVFKLGEIILELSATRDTYSRSLGQILKSQ